MKFDFPLLKAEISKCMKTLQGDLLVIDSLLAMKEIIDESQVRQLQTMMLVDNLICIKGLIPILLGTKRYLQ